MNLTSLDVEQHDVQVGDEVQVVSSDPGAVNSVANLVNIMETIPYEFLVKLQPNIRRLVINADKIKSNE